MFSIFFALLAAAFFLAAISYTNRQDSCWELLENGVWMQRRASNYKAYFLFSTYGGKNTSSLTPELWEIKVPFSENPKYVTQHEDQLRNWWEPLAKHFSSLGANPKTVKFIRFSPTLGIHIKTSASKKTKNAPEEDIIALLLKDANATWKPRRFEVHSGYAIRERLMSKWHWFLSIAIFSGVHGMLAYNYVHFLGDVYYIAVGIITAIIGSGSLAFWFYPKMQGNLYCARTILHIFALGFISMSVTFSYALVGINLISRQTVCEMSVPVTQWYFSSGKNRSYHAVLDLSGCNTNIATQTNINVRRSEYKTGPTVNIRVSRGLLNRYVLEKK